MAELICIIAEPQIDSSTNSFSFNGTRRPIFGGPNSYKIRTGSHQVEICSGNGESWTVEANVGYGEMLTIKLALSGKDISDVMYKVGPTPFGMGFGAMSL